MRTLVSYGFAIALLAGCGAADEHPLGGPYGGSGGAANTSKGDGTGASGTPGDTSGDASSDDGGATVTDDSGVVTPPPGVDSGTQPPPPGHDSGTSPPPPGQDSGTPPQSNAPTWTDVFNNYLANNTQGRCASCHGQMSSKSNAYTWLKGKGYINGTGSAMVVAGRSDLSWFSGNMPPNGPTSWSQAVTDMKAWVAAGAANN